MSAIVLRCPFIWQQLQVGRAIAKEEQRQVVCEPEVLCSDGQGNRHGHYLLSIFHCKAKVNSTKCWNTYCCTTPHQCPRFLECGLSKVQSRDKVAVWLGLLTAASTVPQCRAFLSFQLFEALMLCWDPGWKLTCYSRNAYIKCPYGTHVL